MNTKKLLTSFAVFGVMSMPAFADIANNAESATCDSGTIGVSEGSTILEAQWTAQQIQCAAGTYLESDTAQCTACPAGSYCAGATYTFNGSDLGITGACESGYTTDGSAAAQSDCYRSCTNSDVEHATAVSGKYYYGGNNQCTPTQCAAGYTPKAGFDLASTFSNVNPTNSTWAYLSDNNFYVAGNTTTKQQTYYDVVNNFDFVVDFEGIGMVRGTAKCSATNSTFGTYLDTISEESGQNCFCNINGYRADSSSNWTELSSPWRFYDSFTFFCDDTCTRICAGDLAIMDYYRNPFFAKVAKKLSSCEANTIGITWKPQNGEANTVNQCTYNGAVTIPATPSKVGYDFAGWHVNNAQ